MNWDDVRFFLAVVRHGNHSAAGRALGVAQPTVGRRLQALERGLATRLFERAAGRFVLTAVGRAVLAEAEQVEARMLATQQIARANTSQLAGHVRIAASDWLVTRVLPAAVPAIATRAPLLRVDLELQARLVDLVRNEADLALRPRRFDGDSVWQRSVGYAAFAVYASASYLSRRGAPSLADQCEGHDVILMDDDPGPIADVAWLRRVAARARVRARVNGREPMAQLAVRDLGLACLPTLVGDSCPGLVRVDSMPGAPGRTLWLGVHRDRRDLSRVRSVAEIVRLVVASSLPPRRDASRLRDQTLA